jgi:hypothetical protein
MVAEFMLVIPGHDINTNLFSLLYFTYCISLCNQIH